MSAPVQTLAIIDAHLSELSRRERACRGLIERALVEILECQDQEDDLLVQRLHALDDGR